MITSIHNQQLKEIQNWKKKRKARDESGIFLVEGIRMFLEIPKEKLRKVFVSNSFYQKNQEKLTEKLADFPYELVEDGIFEKISDTQTPQGILCVVEQYHYHLEDLLQQDPFLLLLEDIQDPGNLGTIFRSGEGVGVSGILLSKNSVDIYNPKTIRSTMGSVFRLPFLYVEDFKETLEELKKRQITLYGAYLEGSKDYCQEDYRHSCGFVIGNEGNGIQEDTIKLCDARIRIPMEGKVESLNAAIAASVILYEAYRQRR